MVTKIFSHLTIDQKIVSLIVLVSLFSIIITIGGLSLNHFMSTQENTRREVTIVSDVIASNITAAIIFRDNFAAKELLEALRAQSAIEYAQVTDEQGNVIAKFGRNIDMSASSLVKQDLFQVQVPLIIDSKQIGILSVVANNNHFNQQIKLYLMVVIAVIIIAFLFSILLSTWVQRRFATPIVNLADVANQVAKSGDYSLRAPQEVGGEIGQLLYVFNDMLRKIDQRDQELEALVKNRTCELEMLNQQLANQAYYDCLTKLPNRTLFEDRLKQSIAHAARESSKVALMFIDLDKFKQVNDSWGHAAGDELLCHVARRLEQQCRSMDSVARIGGDEFTMLFILEEDDDINEISRRIIELFQVPFDILDLSLMVTISVGVAIYPTHGYDYDILKLKSDEAMYKAKRLGRNQFCIHQ